ncbi:MAG: sugar ABC transporter permease, partial [Propionibacteriaceae bacterium]|nr:sugar ABC transporter permease [Propionibacteriaceae bacterium]
MLFVAPTAIIILILFVLPLGIVVFMSLSDWPLLGQPKFQGIQNYIAIASQEQFLNAIVFTLGYTLLCTIAIFVLALVMAALLNSPRRGVPFYKTAVFLPYVVGISTASLMWVVDYNDQVGIFSAVLRWLGISDGPVGFFRTPLSATLAVVVMIVWKYVGFQVVLLLMALQAIPASVNEAAMCDGATAWQRFRHITVPFLRPTLALLLVLSVTGSLLAFDQFTVMTQGGPDNTTVTMVMAIYNTAFTSYDLGK